MLFSYWTCLTFLLTSPKLLVNKKSNTDGSSLKGLKLSKMNCFIVLVPFLKATLFINWMASFLTLACEKDNKLIIHSKSCSLRNANLESSRIVMIRMVDIMNFHLFIYSFIFLFICLFIYFYFYLNWLLFISFCGFYPNEKKQ